MHMQGLIRYKESDDLDMWGDTKPKGMEGPQELQGKEVHGQAHIHRDML